MTTCKELCKRYKASKGSTRTYYDQGFKRCQHCAIFIDWNGIYCPCCGTKLRIRARSSKVRRKLLLTVRNK